MSEEARADVHQLAINTIRFLAVDMVEKANSGHPGAPMGQAALAYALWTRHMLYDPHDPSWPNRDRFVLSCGHASALLYALLHLAGFDMPMEQLQNFRQWDSKTPGHPEYGHAEGVETTTGPLGQGLGNAVGMAIARKKLAAEFNRDDFTLFDHRVWAIASDGDIMEGVASEASSLAGHLGLGNLIVFYDDNRITIDGSTSMSFSEDVGKRYEAYGWHVLHVEDGNDLAQVDAAAEAAKAETERPTLVVTRTHIGFGSPAKQDSEKSHGSPLGPDEVKATKENLGWPVEPAFHIPAEAWEPFREAAGRGAKASSAWHNLLGRYIYTHEEPAKDLTDRMEARLPEDWDKSLPGFTPEDGPLATRKASGKVLAVLGPAVPSLVGGSADLKGSNNTYIAGDGDFLADNPGGRNFYFGIREHAMGAIMNGMALSGMFRPYGGTFLIFSDYMRPAIRLAAVMRQPVVYVFTHDSIFLGEDGPTHQPISQLLSLRSIPGLVVIRPADANETAQAWRVALERGNGPTAIALTRQGVPVLPQTAELSAEGVFRGGYVISEADGGDPELILIATGSEVALAIAAQTELSADGIKARVVSLPSWELFDAQDASYRESVLPSGVRKRLAIEAGSPLGWERYVGLEGSILGIEGYGASAPYKVLAEKYGFTAENLTQQAKSLL